MESVSTLHSGGQLVRLIPLSEVIRLTSRSRSRIYAEVQAGTFPPPVKDGSSSRWVEGEIGEWISARIAARNAQGGAA